MRDNAVFGNRRRQQPRARRRFPHSIARPAEYPRGSQPANGYGYSYIHRHSYIDAHSYQHPHTHAHADQHPNAYIHRHRRANTNRHCH